MASITNEGEEEMLKEEISIGKKEDKKHLESIGNMKWCLAFLM